MTPDHSDTQRLPLALFATVAGLLFLYVRKDLVRYLGIKWAGAHPESVPVSGNVGYPQSRLGAARDGIDDLREGVERGRDAVELPAAVV